MSTRRARVDRPSAGAVTLGPDEPAGPAVDAAVADLDDRALEVARSAAADEAGDPELVGPPVDTVAEDGPIVTVRFASLLPGYRGWLWSVTMVLLDDGHPTVSEVVLLPGPDALIAPAWVPWSQRIRSGDLRVGDVLLTAADDPRLVPAYLLSDDPAVERVAHELGVGRARVLSREGRADAAQRWHEGSFGPADEMAKHAPGHCATCAFFLPLAGSLGGGFGVCGNAFSPADGHVVDVAYGCGAHSEATDGARSRSAASEAVVDELRLEVHRREFAAGTAEDAVTGDEPSVTGDRDRAADADDEPVASFAVPSPDAPPAAAGSLDGQAPEGVPADGPVAFSGGEIAPE